MQLNPRYDDPTFLAIRWPTTDPGAPMVRQRRRLAEVAADLDDDQWSAPSRCEGWSVQDVLAHLVSTNQFWTFSIRGAVAGDPTRFLASFDPVATPAELVAASKGEAPADTLARFIDTNTALAEAVEAIDDWDRLGEAPPGHLPLRGVVLHALWDSWIHERDIALPLRLPQPVEPDEVTAALAYAASLGLLFDAVYGDGSPRTLSVVASDPTVELAVELDGGVSVRAGAATGTVLRGSAVELLEALSFRGPFPEPVPDDVMRGLATVFDRAG